MSCQSRLRKVGGFWLDISEAEKGSGVSADHCHHIQAMQDSLGKKKPYVIWFENQVKSRWSWGSFNVLLWAVPFHIWWPFLVIRIQEEGAQLGATCRIGMSTWTLFPEAESLTCDCVLPRARQPFFHQQFSLTVFLRHSLFLLKS